MSDRIKKHNTGFTQVPNILICSTDISCKAKAVYCYLFSRPDSWVFRFEEIVSNFKEGRDAINGAINELIATGWIDKVQVRDAHGHFSHNEYEIFTSPIAVNGKPVNDISVDGKPVNGKTVSGKADAINTESINTDCSNTDGINTNARPSRSEKKASPPTPLDVFGLPPFVKPEVWDSFVAHRKAIKKPLTNQAANLVINKIIKFFNAGHDVNAVLETSVMNGWAGVFEPKAQASSYQSRQEKKDGWLADLTGQSSSSLFDGNTYEGEVVDV